MSRRSSPVLSPAWIAWIFLASPGLSRPRKSSRVGCVVIECLAAAARPFLCGGHAYVSVLASRASWLLGWLLGGAALRCAVLRCVALRWPARPSNTETTPANHQANHHHTPTAMASQGTGYDLSASTYSPDGRIFQVRPLTYPPPATRHPPSTIRVAFLS